MMIRIASRLQEDHGVDDDRQEMPVVQYTSFVDNLLEQIDVMAEG